ncbi:MAG TPA: MFS transporter [Blastocatellia bacterium]|nr:MFS transporter [Blastocatellia bacterium]
MSIPVAENNQSSAGTSRTRESDLKYAWYVVFVLMVCLTLSFIDRQILSLLVGPIKRDLGVNDTAIGLLHGFWFALFYTFMGLPVGWLVDRYSRRAIIAWGVFFWSLMTSLCAVAGSFWSLSAARMGVGVGEATLGPAAMSLTSDYFPKEKLGGALSVYAMGIFIGSGLALIVGGAVVGAVAGMPAVTLPIIGEVASWRLTFLIVGAPGLLVGLLVFTVSEPLRRNLLRTNEGQASHLSPGAVLREMTVRWRSVAGVCVALSAQAACNYAFFSWAPEYFARIHGWGPRERGLTLGVMTLTAGIAGMYAGGKLCDRWVRQGIHEAPLKVGVVGAVWAGVFFGLAMCMPGLTWLLVLMVPAQFFLALPVGSSYAALQLIFPNQLRGQVAALLAFTISIGGQTLGPFLPGVFNDYLFHDGNMIGWSLALTVVLASIVSAAMFKATYQPYRTHYAWMRKLAQDAE